MERQNSLILGMIPRIQVRDIEKLDRKNIPNEKGLTGGLSFSGVYHPNVVCETIQGDSNPGICKHCGITLF